jgi:hypothetical protein
VITITTTVNNGNNEDYDYTIMIIITIIIIIVIITIYYNSIYYSEMIVRSGEGSTYCGRGPQNHRSTLSSYYCM